MKELFEAIAEGVSREQAIANSRDAMRRLERNPRYAGYFVMQREVASWLPGYHPSDAVIGRAEDGALLLHGVACYPWGFAFTIASVSRPGTEARRAFRLVRPTVAAEELLGAMPAALREAMGHEFADPVPPPDVHVEFSDGSRFRVIDVVEEMVERAQAGTSALEDWAADQRYVRSQRGVQLGTAATMSVIGWKLPPSGPLIIEVEWAAHGISLTRHAIDGDAIMAAAFRAKRRTAYDE